ncbi:hypothetical protein [Streptomyces sp. NBC_01718]|uniref:hypothetical protein n=1 Tax=Streptomyces sp. NBC_01718 TaxID=2975919 RepID=UPI002F919E7E
MLGTADGGCGAQGGPEDTRQHASGLVQTSSEGAETAVCVVEQAQLLVGIRYQTLHSGP